MDEVCNTPRFGCPLATFPIGMLRCATSTLAKEEMQMRLAVSESAVELQAPPLAPHDASESSNHQNCAGLRFGLRFVARSAERGSFIDAPSAQLLD